MPSAKIKVLLTLLYKVAPYLWLRRNDRVGQLLVMHLYIIHVTTDMR